MRRIRGPPIKALDRGDVETRLENATKRVTAEYELPFLAHATMEPINTTVHVRPDGCDIWVGTQTPVVAQKHAARITPAGRKRQALPRSAAARIDRFLSKVCLLGGGERVH